MRDVVHDGGVQGVLADEHRYCQLIVHLDALQVQEVADADYLVCVVGETVKDWACGVDLAIL